MIVGVGAEIRMEAGAGMVCVAVVSGIGVGDCIARVVVVDASALHA